MNIHKTFIFAALVCIFGFENIASSQAAAEPDVGLTNYESCTVRSVFSSTAVPVGMITGNPEKDTIAFQVTDTVYACSKKTEG